MSASIIWPVSSGHRHPFRVHGIRALRLLPAVALLLSAAVSAAVEEPSKPFLEKNSFYLSSAGFRIQFANDPAGKKALRALPAHRFVTNGVGDAVRYLYAEPQRCVCIFVGNQQAYDRYRNLLSQPLKPTDNVPADYKTQASILLSNQPPRLSALFVEGTRDSLRGARAKKKPALPPAFSFVRDPPFISLAWPSRRAQRLAQPSD